MKTGKANELELAAVEAEINVVKALDLLDKARKQLDLATERWRASKARGDADRAARDFLIGLEEAVVWAETNAQKLLFVSREARHKADEVGYVQG